MMAPLLTTKLHVPVVRRKLVSRPQLLARLDATWHRPLTLVSAPAGFGKTTLIAEWLQRLTVDEGRNAANDTTSVDTHATSSEKHACAWFSLDEQDNDPSRFFRYLVGALTRVHAGLGGDARDPFQASSPLAVQSLLTDLINGLAALPQHTILVLDDYHAVTSPVIHDALIFLIEHLPLHAHLIVSSRADPPFPLARLRARGQINEIRAVDLRFTLEEATHFLNDVMGLSLGPNEIGALETKTEGWISGLQLAALSLRGRPADREAFISAFGGSHRHIIDYLAAEVLSQQPPAIHDFVCETAILDRLTAPLCDAITGRQDSAKILIQLEQDNLFVVPLDERREWYRYHRLFSDFLRNHLEQDYPERVRDLHCWAAEWFEENGHPAQAIDHALKASDFQWAARLIEKQAQQTLMHGQINRILDWLEALPRDVRKTRSPLSVYYASALLVAGRWQDAERQSMQLQQTLEEGDSLGLQGSQIGQIHAIRAYLAIYRGNLPQAVEHARQASTYLSKDTPFLRNVVNWMQGFASLFYGDIKSASEVLIENIESSKRAGNVLMTMLSVYVYGYTLALRGHLNQAVEFLERGLHWAQVEGQRLSGVDNRRSLASAGIVHQGLGEVLRERNDLIGAQRHSEKAVDLCKRWGNAEPLVDAYIVLARVRRAQRQWASAHQALQEAEDLALTDQVSNLTAWQVDLHRARLWIAQGELEAAAACTALNRDPAQIADVPQGPVLSFLSSLERATTARLYIAREEFVQAIQILQPALDQVDSETWRGIGIELMALQSLAYLGHGLPDAAFTLLEGALSMALSDGYARVFLDEGQPMADLFSRLRCRGVPTSLRAYVDRLLESFVLEAPKESRPQPVPQPPSLTEPLTPREQQVLKLIAAGLSNKEIAKELVVALSTVKTHINHIYRKLDVSKRTEALVRAQKLHLL
jgi:LuxR family maltose regulon positive regulatory protein